MNKKIFFIILAAIFSAVILSQKIDYKKISENPERKLSSYGFNPDSSVLSRISDVPDFVLEYLKKMDRKDNYKNYRPGAGELKNIEDDLNLLPASVKDVLRKNVVKIYFVENFLGSGLTDWVLDEKMDLYFIMVFNPEVLKHDISDWLTRKESSCFIHDDDNYKIRIDCGNRLDGFLYILMHESAHVYDYLKSITPAVEPDLSVFLIQSAVKTGYVRGIWKDYSRPEREADFESRKLVTFYNFSGGPKISISDSENVYRELSGSPFASLYGSMNWAEDFSEMFTFYHLTNKLNQQFKIEVYKDKKLIYSLEPMKGGFVSSRFKVIEKCFDW